MYAWSNGAGTSGTVRRWLGLVALAAATSACLAQSEGTPATAAANTINWYRYDMPPISIPNGPMINQGINDRVMERLVQALPQYQHRMQEANFARITENMRQGAQGLAVGFQKTPERQEVMLFSEPFTIALAPSAIVRKSQAAKVRAVLDADGALPLAEVLERHALQLGISSGRSYLSGINAVLDKNRDNPSVFTRSAGDMSSGILNMLQLGRFDITILYPEEAQYLARQLEGKVELISFPIKEAPAPALVYIVAPKTPWGAQILEQINPLIIKQRVGKTLLQEREAWLDTEARQRYVRQFQSLIDTAPRKGVAP